MTTIFRSLVLGALGAAALTLAAQAQPATTPPAHSAAPAFDLSQLEPHVRDAVIEARRAQALGHAAAVRAQNNADLARQSGAVKPVSGYGIDPPDSGDKYNGDIYLGSWANSHYDGDGVYTYAINENNPDDDQANLRYAGDYVQGDPQGYGEWDWRNGNHYAGGENAGKRNGSGVFQFHSGARYEGEYSNDLRNGYGVYWNADGQAVQQGVWTDSHLTTPLSK